MKQLRIGITGGIGSGKSVVSRLLRVMDIPVYDSDSESKRLIQSDPKLIESLRSLVGDGLYIGGILQRTVLAAFIFGNDSHLHQVNAIIHPAVKEDFIDWCLRHSEAALVGFESAILFDAHCEKYLDSIIDVTAPLECRIRRTMLRDSTTRQLVLHRIEAQMSEEERLSRSDFVIHNDDVTPLILQVNTFLSRYK